MDPKANPYDQSAFYAASQGVETGVLFFNERNAYTIYALITNSGTFPKGIQFQVWKKEDVKRLVTDWITGDITDQFWEAMHDAKVHIAEGDAHHREFMTAIFRYFAQPQKY